MTQETRDKGFYIFRGAGVPEQGTAWKGKSSMFWGGGSIQRRVEASVEFGKISRQP